MELGPRWGIEGCCDNKVPCLRVDGSDSGTRLQEGTQSVGIEGRDWICCGRRMRGSDYLFVGLAWRAQLLLEGDTASADQSEVADFFREKDSGEQAGSVCVRSDSTTGLGTSTNRYQFRGYPTCCFGVQGRDFQAGSTVGTA